MACDKYNSYRNEKFSEQTPFEDFFFFGTVRDLEHKITNNKTEIIRCRTVGIMQSLNGHFYLSDIDANSKADSRKLLINIAYLRSSMPCSVIPNGVQIFGTIEWQEKPVLVANILQVLSLPMVIRLKNAITGITNIHLATHKKDCEENV
ncbi:unnamed protein product [Colias eurytheme]|nr:unnamed protein product [Colias eurytheme]